jgi:tetratricopeptide (TPR) repeat protein/S1-C subfamily serine protease
VKIIADDQSAGSGFLIKKEGWIYNNGWIYIDGFVYTIVTNDHVINGKKSLQIQTPDNKIYEANVETQRQIDNSKKENYSEDIAILTFFSDQNYSVATLSQKTIKPGDKVLASGFVKDQLKITEGKVEILLDEHLKEGHQIGYSNNIEQGMSGGAIINSKGELIGINARYANPVVPDFILQDGSKPNQETEEKWAKYSWGLHILSVNNIAPELLLFPYETFEQWGGIPADVKTIAKSISVRIDGSDNSGGGSGVIIARDKNTYWVLTANHVVTRDRRYRVETPDGKIYKVNNKTIQGNDVSDIAVFQFKSKENYQVATLANYPLNKNEQFIFTYGWQGEKINHPSIFTVGLIKENSLKDFFAKPKDYDLAYTNLAYPGMSGGPILDTEGRLIGILNAVGQLNILDYNYGMSSSSILKEEFIKNLSLKVEEKQPKQADLMTEVLKYFAGYAPDQKTGSAAEWLNYATQLWRSGRNEEALDAINTAYRKNFNSYQAFYNAGFIYLSQGEYDLALRMFNKSIAIQREDNQKSFDRHYIMKSLILSELKRYQEAEDTLTEGIEIIRKANQGKDISFNLYSLRGDIYSGQKEWDVAIDDYNKVIKIIDDYNKGTKNKSDYTKHKSDYKQAYLDLGNVYFERENYPEAIKQFTTAIEIDPQDIRAYIRRGLAHSQERTIFRCDI